MTRRPSLRVFEGGRGLPMPAFVPSPTPPRHRAGPLVLLWTSIVASGFLTAAGIAWVFNTACRLLGLGVP